LRKISGDFFEKKNSAKFFATPFKTQVREVKKGKIVKISRADGSVWEGEMLTGDGRYGGRLTKQLRDGGLLTLEIEEQQCVKATYSSASSKKWEKNLGNSSKHNNVKLAPKSGPKSGPEDCVANEFDWPRI